MNDNKYLVLCYSFLPFGPARLTLLTKYFKSAKNVWHADKKALLETGINSKLVEKFILYRKNIDTEKYFQKLKRLGIEYLTINDSTYPNNLKDLSNAPLVLYVLGNLNRNDSNAVSIVGTRKITAYGKSVTENFAYELAQVGVTIISGLALGIDAVAHRAALEAGGRTIAVLASGLDTITPASNKWIADRIIKNGCGAIVSEYPLGVKPLKNFFANRNRIISGMSKAVIVVEGRQKSGTLLTASAAAEQGREVFAVPGQVTSPMSEAPHFLIKNGAKIAFSAKDVLDDLDLQLKVDKEAVEKVMPSDELEKKILKIIENEPLHIDEIVRKSKLTMSDVSSKLTMMELKGLVKNSGGMYSTYK
jgi:DNA processing protein